MNTRRRRLAWTLLAAAAAGGPAWSEDAGPLAEPPAYETRAEAALPEGLDAAAGAAVRRLLDGAPPEQSAASVRRLAGIGPGALPRIAAALRGASWRARAALVAAVAEMDAPQATPLLAAAARDPSFAVREAAVTGLGKTGDAACAGAVAERTRPGGEPAWRVRAAAATALRRGVLRGVVPRGAAGPVLAEMFDDADPDVVRAALAASGPLALPETLPRLLAVFQDPAAPARDRAAALTALRAYRDPSPELVAALRRAFLAGTDAEEAVRAGRALLDIRGRAALDDPEVAEAAVRNLTDEAARDMRDALLSLGPGVRPWLAARARAAADRVASSRDDPGASPFEPLADALFQSDEAAGLDLVREVLAGPRSDALHVETRRWALRKAQFGFAARLGPELRALLASRSARDLHADILRAVAASGGDDVPALVGRALGDERSDVRNAALDVLDTIRSVPTPPALADLVAKSERVRERVRALACLGRRDRGEAIRLALPLLGHPDPDLRAAAVTELGSARDAATADILRRRLRDEDGRSSHGAATGPEPLPPAATTGSDVAETADRIRRTLRASVVRALRAVAGAGARDDLLALAFGDPDAKVRETAVQELRGLAAAADAPALADRTAAEPDDAVRTEVERLLATLGDAPAAQAHFARHVADPSRRAAALRLLSEDGARVVPEGLAAAAEDAAWGDDERVSALRILDRSGRAPAAAALARIARSARSLDLVAEAVRVLAADPSPAAADAVAALLAEETDPARRALAARGLGERRSPASTALLASLLDSHRAAALAAETRTSPLLQVYRECALALGRIGSEDAGRVLVEHLLDAPLAAAAARRSVHAAGPFQPEEGAVVTLVRTLVAAAAHVDDATLARLVGEALARREADGSQWVLDEEYVEGLARYLNDPAAYDLPARRRSAAALPLWTLAARSPPRWSALDADAWRGAAGELETQGRIAEARAAFEAGVAAADVEDAARSREDRLWEAGRLLAFRAREAAAAGRADEAAAIAASIRAPDPASADLAYLHGWCRVKIGRADEEAAESLRAALAREARHANAVFFLAWIAQATRGAEASLPLWDEAVRLDARRVADAAGDAASGRGGRPHRWGHFPYWQARALAAAGRDADAGAALAAAILLDDRFAAQALSDEAFAAFAGRAEFVAGELRRIPDEPRR